MLFGWQISVCCDPWHFFWTLDVGLKISDQVIVTCLDMMIGGWGEPANMIH